MQDLGQFLEVRLSPMSPIVVLRAPIMLLILRLAFAPISQTRKFGHVPARVNGKGEVVLSG